jgi:hypothetical protein
MQSAVPTLSAHDAASPTALHDYRNEKAYRQKSPYEHFVFFPEDLLRRIAVSLHNGIMYAELHMGMARVICHNR